MRRCVLISNTPTLAVVGGTYLPESGQLTSKVVVLHRPEWLGENISKLLVRAYVSELYLLSLDLFPKPVVFYIKMLRSLCQTGITSDPDARLRVVVQWHTVVVRKNPKILP